MFKAVSTRFVTGDMGDDEINLTLNVNQLTFIISGLRDLAAGCQKRIDLGTDEVEMEESVRDDNLALADHLEAIYLG